MELLDIKVQVLAQEMSSSTQLGQREFHFYAKELLIKGCYKVLSILDGSCFKVELPGLYVIVSDFENSRRHNLASLAKGL